MGNFFKDAFDVIKDPTSWNPVGLVTNTALKATGNRTIGEGVVHAFQGDDPELGDTSDIESKASDLAANPPQASLQDILDQANAMAEANIKRAPEISRKASEVALERAGELDSFMEERFFRNIEKFIDPESDIIGETKASRERFKELSATAEGRLGGIFEDISGVASEFLSGELPQDVREQIMRDRAELNLGQGLFGDVASSATARDLGLTSLDLVMRGIETSGLAANLATQEANLLASLETGVSDQTRLLLGEAQSLMPPVSDPVGLFSAEAARFAGASLVSPTSVLQTGADITKFNASTQFDALLSEINVGMDIFSTQAQIAQNQAALKVAKQGQMLDFAGTVIGAGASFAGK